MSLARLTGRSLTFPETERFIVFDGRELRACRDAEAAIAVVARSKRWCSVVDLASLRAAVQQAD